MALAGVDPARQLIGTLVVPGGLAYVIYVAVDW
jgi:hypothetical protein